IVCIQKNLRRPRRRIFSAAPVTCRMPQSPAHAHFFQDDEGSVESEKAAKLGAQRCPAPPGRNEPVPPVEANSKETLGKAEMECGPPQDVPVAEPPGRNAALRGCGHRDALLEE